MTFARPSSVLVLLAAAVMGIVVLGAISMIAMAQGGWGMGWGMGDHMSRMMGGGTNTSNAPVTAGGSSASVSIQDFAFSPGNLVVPVGASVTFTNYDSAPHSATAKDRSWDTGILNKGESKTLTLATAGDYTYFCTVHPNMVARLQVQ